MLFKKYGYYVVSVLFLINVIISYYNEQNSNSNPVVYIAIAITFMCIGISQNKKDKK